MRCTAKVKDGADPLAQLRAAQPMPRGERLYASRHAIPRKPPHRMLGVFDETRRKELGDAYYANTILEYAAPLALARERRRRERAEAKAHELRENEHDLKLLIDEAWDAAHELGKRLNEARAEVARLQPPTREEVERAVAELEEAYDALIDAPALDVAANSRHQAARAALVKLATRGT